MALIQIGILVNVKTLTFNLKFLSSFLSLLFIDFSGTKTSKSSVKYLSNDLCNICSLHNQ